MVKFPLSPSGQPSSSEKSWRDRALVSLSPLLFIVAVGWILFAFHSYLPAPLRLVDFYLRRSGAYDVLLALWFSAVSYCVGKQFLRLLGVTTVIGAEEAAFSIASGAMLFSWVLLILALLHGLYRPVAYLLLLAPTIIWRREMGRLPGIVCRALADRIKSLSWTATAIGNAFLGLYICASLGVILISALGPSFEYDDLIYHLVGPKNFVLAHKLVSLPDIPHTFFPKNIEMLHTLGMLLHNDIVSKLLVFLSGCIAMVAIYGFMARFVSRTAGMIAAAILASSPLFIWEMRTAHVEVGLTLFIFGGVYATVLWLKTRETPWFRLACFFLAFSLGIKYWAFLSLGIILLLVFLVILKQSRAFRPALSAAFKLGFYSSLGLLPWGLINFYCTGNPVFPLLNEVFHSPYWTSALTEMGLGEWFNGGVRITFSNWWELFRVAWDMVVDPQSKFQGNIGPWYVIFIPFLIVFSEISFELGFVLCTGILYYVGWAAKGPLARFLLPALPCLAAGAAFAIMRLLQTLNSFRKSIAVTAGILLGALAILASPYFEADGSWARYGNPPLLSLPLKLLSGGETRGEYLRRSHNLYSVLEYVNKIPGDKKVLYVHSTADGFYLKGKAAFQYSFYIPGLAEKDADFIHRTLRQQGITHLWVEQTSLEPSNALSSQESEFTHRYLRKLYQKYGFIFYELLPDRIDQQVVVYDFLEHLNETRAGQMQRGLTGSAFKAVQSVGDDGRMAMVMAPPADAEFLARIPDQARLTFAIARENSGCTGKGSVQVWVSTPESARNLIYNRDMEGNIDRWNENELDLSEYAGRRVMITFRTEEVTPCGKYYVADPVLVAPNNITQHQKTSEEQAKLPDAGLTVTSGSVTPSQVRLGQSIEVSFSGPALNRETYFDLRYRGPGDATDQIITNYQQGASSRHPVVSSTQPGAWVITGVRAHRLEMDHEGTFHALWIPFAVGR
jgi:hypothetical protein